MNAAETMRKARLEAGLSVRELAAAIGITQQFVRDIEAGRRGIPAQMVPRFPPRARAIVAAAFAAIYQDRAKEMLSFVEGNGNE